MSFPTTRQVLDATEVVNRKRPDGSAIKIAECTVGDQSGTIMFTARNKQGARASTPACATCTRGPNQVPSLVQLNLSRFPP